MILFVSTSILPLKRVQDFKLLPCTVPHSQVQVTDMSFTPVMNDEPVLTSAIVNGHQFRALLYTEVSHLLLNVLLWLLVGWTTSMCMGTTHDIQMTLNADGQALSWVLENVAHDMLLENIFPIPHDLIQPVLVVVTIPSPQRSDSEAALGYVKRIKFKLYRPEMTKH